MQPVATSAQMRQLDRLAIEEWGVPSLELMERAARAVAQAVHGLLAAAQPQTTGTAPQIGVLCGPGNNGGDGIAAARLLRELGYEARAFLVGDRGKMTPDARAMEERLRAAGGALEDFHAQDQRLLAWLSACDCLVDALLGVGLRRPVEGDFLCAVQLMQDKPGCPVVSCDIPSGVQADTGAVLGAAVKARVTVTFTCAKPGLYLGEGGPRAGRLQVAQIGIPSRLVEQRLARDAAAGVLERRDCTLPRRRPTAHKGDFGKVFILAGAEQYTGAPALCAGAAVRAGAGLVFLGVPPEIYPIMAMKCTSAMPFPLPEDYGTILEKARGCDVALIGPGLGRNPQKQELVRSLLQDLDIPVVLDADGINALAGHIDSLDSRTALTVLTPHEGEFARLTGSGGPPEDRLSAARAFARDHRCLLVLKGHRTVTAAPDGRAFLNPTGNPGMAKGGSGDVLAGVIAAFLGQGQLAQAWGGREAVVAAAVYCHGLAGDRCARRLGEYGMTPDDLVRALPSVWRELEDTSSGG